jgi:hypothetical protein
VPPTTLRSTLYCRPRMTKLGAENWQPTCLLRARAIRALLVSSHNAHLANEIYSCLSFSFRHSTTAREVSLRDQNAGGQGSMTRAQRVLEPQLEIRPSASFKFCHFLSLSYSSSLRYAVFPSRRCSISVFSATRRYLNWCNQNNHVHRIEGRHLHFYYLCQ